MRDSVPLEQPIIGERRRRREQERLRALTAGEPEPPALGSMTAPLSTDAVLPGPMPTPTGPAAPRPLTRRELRARAAQAATEGAPVGFVPEPPPAVPATTTETGATAPAPAAADDGAYRWWHLAVLAVVAFVLGMLVVRVVTDAGDGAGGTSRPDAAPISTTALSTTVPIPSTDPTGE